MGDIGHSSWVGRLMVQYSGKDVLLSVGDCRHSVDRKNISSNSAVQLFVLVAGI